MNMASLCQFILSGKRLNVLSKVAVHVPSAHSTSCSTVGSDDVVIAAAAFFSDTRLSNVHFFSDNSGKAYMVVPDVFFSCLAAGDDVAATVPTIPVAPEAEAPTILLVRGTGHLHEGDDAAAALDSAVI